MLALLVATVVGPLVGDHRSVDTLSLLPFAPLWFTLAKMAGIWSAALAVSVAAERYVPGIVGALRPRWRDLWFLALGAAAQVLINLAYRPFHPRHLDGPTRALFLHLSTGGVVVLGVGVLVGAPLAEELLFRGLLVTALRRALPTARWTVPVILVSSGLLFALAHGEWLQLPGLAALGVLLAGVYLRESRVLPCILTHAGFNAVALVGVLTLRAGGHG
jgi:membrane protease YdiL (CAAX protease family)